MAARPSVWILGDQLARGISSLAGLAPGECEILMVESRRRARQLPFHKQKLTFVRAAMRERARELRAAGYPVDYRAEAEGYEVALTEHLAAHAPSTVRIMETAEHGNARRLSRICERAGAATEITDNNSFITDHSEFEAWSSGRKILRMEDFYRRARVQTGLLMDEDGPAGGEWNFDKLNRKRAPAGHRFPDVSWPRRRRSVTDVARHVEAEFPDHMGSAGGMRLPVTRTDAEAFLADFLDVRLDLFGPYQDAIVVGERVMYHSFLAALLNVGLLDPLDVCQAAEQRYRDGSARLESVEGFIRQILGWREFIYHVYRSRMPGYLESNELGAELPLPEFYWNAATDMACVGDAVEAVIDNAANHHIQRLMITGNFALLAGLSPQAVNDWYRAAYIDAYEWVVAPNVLGMALYADGGVFATKPYAASAAYVNRMSDACKGCRYDPRKREGEDACPFNALYWDFLARNNKKLGRNHRMAMMYANLRKMDAAELRRVRRLAGVLRDRLAAGETV